MSCMDIPGGSDGKESTYSAGELGSIPQLVRSLEEEIATCSSIVDWRIPWTEEPGRLQSMGSQRVEHSWVTFPFTYVLYNMAVVSVLQ